MPARVLTPEIAQRWIDEAAKNAANVVLKTAEANEPNFQRAIQAMKEATERRKR